MSKITIAIHASALMLSVICSSPGIAQQTTTQMRSDPNRTEKIFDAFQDEQKRTKKTPIQVQRAERPEISTDTRPLFKLKKVSIKGARVIPGELIAKTYRAYIGNNVSQADLTKITSKISDLYRDEGYSLSRAIIPPQDIKNGHIHIRVLEGHVAEIILKGAGAEKFGVRRMLDVIKAERPSRLKTLERQMLLVNDIPGVLVADTVLEEIGESTGRFRLIVILETWRIFTAFGLDNRGTSEVGPLQFYMAPALNSYFTDGDTLRLNLSTIPDATRELGFSRLTYDAPIGTRGARFGIMASYSEIRPGDERRKLNTRTRIESVEVNASIIPQRTRKSSLWLSAAASLYNDTERNSLGANYSDHIRTVSLTADYQLHDKLKGSNYLTTILRHGGDILGGSDRGDAMLSRNDGSGDFSKLGFTYRRYQKLSNIWSLNISAAGQMASTALLSSEEFYIGGPIFGRGYDSGELSGDNGLAGSVELRLDKELKRKFIKGYQLYGFADRGLVWNFRDGEDDVYSLSSAGAGMRLYLPNELRAGIEIAAPLNYRSPANTDRDLGVFFSLSKTFKFCPRRDRMRCENG